MTYRVILRVKSNVSGYWNKMFHFEDSCHFFSISIESNWMKPGFKCNLCYKGEVRKAVFFKVFFQQMRKSLGVAYHNKGVVRDENPENRVIN